MDFSSLGFGGGGGDSSFGALSDIGMFSLENNAAKDAAAKARKWDKQMYKTRYRS